MSLPGGPASSMATRWKFTGRAFAYGALMRPNQGGEHYRCGQKAANDLAAFVARRPVSCIEVDRDQYKRAVAVCTVAGTDLAEWLVKNGLARAWLHISKGS